ncbi:MAG: prolyl aminopeptidase [Chromatiales bacterium]
MRELYPAIEPAKTLMLKAGSLHRVYVEECGDSSGIPVVFLHGGPGSGCKPYHRQFFDPSRYRIVLFDQRGCGRSTPPGETRENTTADSLADMEMIRRHLGIERWVVFGGSWGATLALLYGQAHPQRVLAMILRGTFLARQRDLDWFFADGVNAIFPDYWEETMAALDASENLDMIEAAYRGVHSGDPGTRLAAARAWSTWTGRIVTYLLPETSGGEPAEDERQRILNEVAVETHYARHRYFLREDQILRDIARLPRVPTWIIHGRRDLTCTLSSSWSLYRALPGSKLVIVHESGHLASEPAMIDALVTATNELPEALQ